MSMPSPLVSPVVFHLGPVPVVEEVVTTWGIIVVLWAGAYLSTRGLSAHPAKPGSARPSGRVQAAVEAVFVLLEDQIRGVLQRSCPSSGLCSSSSPWPTSPRSSRG
jgi:F-type H+-transporting ATPase subunit a